MHDDFLFELGCEELPTKAVKYLSQALCIQIQKQLDTTGIPYGGIRTFATPRRLALYISELPQKTAAQDIIKRGPAYAHAYDHAGNPTKALLGFMQAQNIQPDQLSVLETDKGTWVQSIQKSPGRPCASLVAEYICSALDNLPMIKPMRWGNTHYTFARPVHWLVMLYGHDIIPCTLFGCEANRITYGHRFHHTTPITLTHPTVYASALQDAYVIADYDQRKDMIVAQIHEIAEAHDAQAIIPEALLDEVTSIVEWPVALDAQFDPIFLAIPQEALIAAMQVHQKSFALVDQHRQLLPRFITIANLKSSAVSAVIHGVEKVMRARLSDAYFFFTQDLKTPLENFIPKTKNIIAQARLGTLYDKSQRIKQLMQTLASTAGFDIDAGIRAAELCKCDLLSGMVGEFPELQGIMGHHYARHTHESQHVASALEEQYLPRFANDALPASSIGIALALADRADTLVGNFLVGNKPANDKDPFKLRRHALGLVRILSTSPGMIKLCDILDAARAVFSDHISTSTDQYPQLHAFILERLAAYYQAQGIPHDRILAVLQKEQNGLYDIQQRIHALHRFTQEPDAIHLSAASKRVSHMLQSLPSLSTQSVCTDLLTEPAEIYLYNLLQNITTEHQEAFAHSNYTTVLQRLTALRTPLDQFFDTVIVLHDNPAIQNNRIALLQQLTLALNTVADLSYLQW